jgi:group I intron endonuclease
MGYIYKITNKVTGKCYIGETVQNYKRRWGKHINCLKYKEGCPLLKASMKKHGVDKFTFEILIICFDEDLVKYEKEYIKKYNSQAPNGYNILSGGQIGQGMLGYKHTQTSIEKIRESGNIFRRNNPDHFETYREKHKESMSKVDISSCMKKSEKFQKAILEKRVGRHNINLSDESKQKISESLKKYYQNAKINNTKINRKKPIINTLKNNKAVLQYTKDETFMNEYISISEAGRLSGVKKSNIDHVLAGRNKTAGGFVWKYKK